MAIPAISALEANPIVDKISMNLDKSQSVKSGLGATEETGFSSLFDSIVNTIKQTDEYTNQAEEEEIKYAAGADKTLELLVAQNKANLSLSYTVAVRDKILDAYKEIMNMQF